MHMLSVISFVMFFRFNHAHERINLIPAATVDAPPPSKLPVLYLYYKHTKWFK